MKITTIGIDLGKTVFHLIGMDDRGAILLKKRVSRSQMVTLLANTPACIVGMEASCGAHHLGRELTAQGHDVRLIPAQFVKPFVKSQKNDYVDAEAIAEAVQRPTMRFVPVKTADQLDLQAVHRVRDRLIERRTGTINQLRAFLLERGMVIRTGRKYLQETLPAVLAEAEEKMSPRLSRLLAVLVKEWKQLEEEIAQMDAEIGEIAKQDASCQRLLTVPGVGPLVATALVAAVGNGAAFSKGREFAAWLGLVPRQCSTGGKPKLLGISNHGNEYLRRLFIHGARSVVARANRGKHRFGSWISSLETRANPNVVSVAMANKIARIAWAVLNKGTDYATGPRRLAPPLETCHC
jgi:transposase